MARVVANQSQAYLKQIAATKKEASKAKPSTKAAMKAAMKAMKATLFVYIVCLFPNAGYVRKTILFR